MVEAIWEAEKAVAMAVALEVAVMRVARVAERVANNKKGSTGAPAAVVFEQHQKWARNNRTLDLIPDEQSRWCNQPQSAAISRLRPPATAISRHQPPSAAINSIPIQQSAVISFNQSQSAAISRNQPPSIAYPYGRSSVLASLIGATGFGGSSVRTTFSLFGFGLRSRAVLGFDSRRRSMPLPSFAYAFSPSPQLRIRGRA